MWRIILNFFIAAPLILITSFFELNFKENPYFYYKINQFDNCRKILNEIHLYNKKRILKDIRFENEYEKIQKEDEINLEEYLANEKNCIFFLSFMKEITYLGIIFSLKLFGQNMLKNFLIFTVIEFFSLIIAGSQF